MNLNTFNGGGAHSIPPMESGTYNAVCCGIVDLGTQDVEFLGESTFKEQLLLLFEFPEETIEINGEIKPRNLSLKLTKSIHEKSSLRKHLVSWRGRDFTEEELNDFYLGKLLGVPATVGVVRKGTNGKSYSVIATIGKPMKGINLTASRRVYFDLSDLSTHTPATFADLPDWIIGLINQSAEAKAAGWAFTNQKGSVVTADNSSEDVPF